MHKRFRNPRKGYSRPKAEHEIAQLVDETLATQDDTAPDRDQIAELMAAPGPHGDQSEQPKEAVDPEHLTVTRVVRGASAAAADREPTAAQRRIDRLLSMLRRSR